MFKKVHADETVWTIEDSGTLLNIVLAKTDFVKNEIVWEALLEDGSFRADPITYHEMRKKMDLEKFQIEVLSLKVTVVNYVIITLTKSTNCFNVSQFIYFYTLHNNI